MVLRYYNVFNVQRCHDLNPSKLPVDTIDDTPDLDFNDRRIDDPDTTDTGNGTPPFVDMGAY